jgi:hypothetical protein
LLLFWKAESMADDKPPPDFMSAASAAHPVVLSSYVATAMTGDSEGVT